jgi:hypothetical protein
LVDQIQRNETKGNIGWGENKCIHSFDGKTRRKTSTGSSRSRWEDNMKLTLKEQGGRMWLDVSGSGQRRVSGCSEYGNETLGLIKRKEFRGYPKNYWLLKNDSATRYKESVSIDVIPCM